MINFHAMGKFAVRRTFCGKAVNKNTLITEPTTVSPGDAHLVSTQPLKKLNKLVTLYKQEFALFFTPVVIDV